MAYQPFYQITDWKNSPSKLTPLNRANLLHIEQGIKEADTRIQSLDLMKCDQATANSLVKNVTVNTNTGVITVTLLNGTVVTYDLDIERVVANFTITDDNIMVLTLKDGTQKRVDLTKFVYTFANTSTITMSMVDRVIKAQIVDGSVTMAKLDATIQQTFIGYLNDAVTAKDLSLSYAKNSMRYAIGNADEFPGSETDNSKYYMERAKFYADLSKEFINDGGEYSASTSYLKGTLVHYNGNIYITLKPVTGITPANDGVNYSLFMEGITYATTSKAGLVKPSGTDFIIGTAGALNLKTVFTKATSLVNIATSEAFATMLGKIARAIDAVIGLVGYKQVTFTADRWIGTGSYSQAQMVMGITADDTPIPMLVDNSSTYEASKLLKKEYGYITYFDSTTNNIIATCKYKKPTSDITIRFKGV